MALWRALVIYENKEGEKMWHEVANNLDVYYQKYEHPLWVNYHPGKEGDGGIDALTFAPSTRVSLCRSTSTIWLLGWRFPYLAKNLWLREKRCISPTSPTANGFIKRTSFAFNLWA